MPRPHRSRSASALLLLLLLPLAAQPVSAQAFSPALALGAAVPTGRLGAHRGVGPLVRAGALIGGADRRVRLRAEAEVAWFPGSMAPVPAPLSAAYGDLRVVSALGSLVIGPRGRGPALYGVLGGGVQWMRVESLRSPYGAVPGLRLGVGARTVVRGAELRVEVAPHVILSDYATGSDFTAGTYWPVSVGLTF